MNVRITFKGGPLDGTFELRDFSPITPPNDAVRFMAWTYYLMSGDEVGKSSAVASPAAIALLATDAVKARDSGATLHQYVTAERTVSGDDVFVLAAYVPASPDK